MSELRSRAQNGIHSRQCLLKKLTPLRYSDDQSMARALTKGAKRSRTRLWKIRKRPLSVESRV
jgi:hypothetical protein